MFLTGVRHLDLYLDLVKSLAWIFPEVSIFVISVKANIDLRTVSVKLRKVVPGWPGGWVAKWVADGV